MFSNKFINVVVIGFWSIIFTFSIMGLFAFIPVSFKTIIISVFVLCYYTFVFNRTLKMKSRVFRILLFSIYFLGSSLLFFIAISTPFALIIGENLDNQIVISIFFLIGMMSPYLFILTEYCFIKQMQVRIKENLKFMKLGMSFATTLVTIILTIIVVMDVTIFITKMIYVLLIIPFGANLISINIIESYYTINDDK